MNITSVMRATGSAVLVTTFAFAPMLPISETMYTSRILSIPVAEAAAISYGNISGVVRMGSSVDATNKVASNITVNLYLNESGSFNASTITDVNGFFSFTAAQGLNYKIEIVPSVGYGIPVGATSSEVVTSLQNSAVISNFTVDKLPAIKMFGPAVMNITVGGVYADPGIVFQKEDGTSVTGYGIEATGSVNTNVIGEYTIKYHVDSKATNGYPTIDAVRTVNVVASQSLNTIKTTMIVVPAKTTALSTSNLSSCTLVSSYLGKSFSNDKLEVLKLQAFLFFKEGFSKVKATGVYDDATELAVRNFQDRYFKDVLTPWGIVDNTGEVRMTTLKKINDNFCGVSTAFTEAQELAFASYKSASMSSNANVITDTPLVLETKDTQSFAGKISSWWKNTKNSLIAVLPGFNKTDETVASDTVSSTVVAKIDNEKSDVNNLASTNSTKTGGMSTVATIISLLLGIAAFLVAFYLYRKTRGVVPAVVEPEITHVSVSKK